MTLPTLYKKTSTGAIQQWEIRVAPLIDQSAAHIVTIYGQVGTDSPQETFDAITKGKNKGKKNETTPVQQAEAEAQAKWEKQKKKGYVESIEAAQNDQLDALIEGGIVPMLAHKFSDHGHKIKYPAYVQPKLDGIRCIAMLKDGKCTLWSRTRKPITSMPHIVKAIEDLNLGEDRIFDGELYNHQIRITSKDREIEIPEGTIVQTANQLNFEKIVSLVRQEEPGEGHEMIQYHIYDIPSEELFHKRAVKLRYFRSKHPLFVVETRQVEKEKEVVPLFEYYKEQGYEGAMLRNSDGKYVNKRSYDLQKVKEFDDAEFPIIGVDEGRGKLAGHVGAFICRAANGKEFLAKMSGDTGKLKEYFENHSLWQGKILTVQYQGLTGAEQVPRFPVGIAIRDYE